VLAACPQPAFQVLDRVIGHEVDLVFANSMWAAQTVLRTTPELAMVICGLHFDESRMHDLLELVRRDFPAVPFLGVRMLDYESRRTSIQAAVAATQALGAVGFVDFATISDADVTEADLYLRQVALSHLRPITKK
jgi:hypothetical protein